MRVGTIATIFSSSPMTWAVAHRGCYGKKLIQAPALDRMAAERIRFTQSK